MLLRYFGKIERQSSKIAFLSFNSVIKGMNIQKVAMSKIVVITILVAVLSTGILASQVVDIGLKSGSEISSSTSTDKTTTVSTIVLTTTSTTTMTASGGELTPPQIFKQVEESVVSISVTLPGGSAQGSGFLFDDKGDIVTNNHVVEGATSIDVTFLDGTTVSAELVGSDAYADLAVVKVDSSSRQLKPMRLGDSDKLEIGDQVLAIGNPFGLSGSMTEGIVSQLGRESQGVGGYLIIDLIQIDAVVNPGNSGGPLLNMNGEVVGVNTLIVSQSGSFEGVGFSIPSNMVTRVATALIGTGKYEHPWVGIQGVDVTPKIADAVGLNQSKGVLTVQVVAGGPAETAGVRGGTTQATIDGQNLLLGGDVVVGIDGKDVRQISDILLYIERNMSPGDTVTLQVIREGQKLSVPLTLGVRPPAA
jgi:S1-C subfamily serine protease